MRTRATPAAPDCAAHRDRALDHDASAATGGVGGRDITQLAVWVEEHGAPNTARKTTRGTGTDGPPFSERGTRPTQAAQRISTWLAVDPGERRLCRPQHSA